MGIAAAVNAILSNGATQLTGNVDGRDGNCSTGSNCNTRRIIQGDTTWMIWYDALAKDTKDTRYNIYIERSDLEPGQHQ